MSEGINVDAFAGYFSEFRVKSTMRVSGGSRKGGDILVVGKGEVW